jgi:hypothetical protein
MPYFTATIYARLWAYMLGCMGKAYFCRVIFFELIIEAAAWRQFVCVGGA